MIPLRVDIFNLCASNSGAVSGALASEACVRSLCQKLVSEISRREVSSGRPGKELLLRNNAIV